MKLLALSAAVLVLVSVAGAQTPPAWQDHDDVSVSSVAATQIHGRSLTAVWRSYQNTGAVGCRLSSSSPTVSSVRGFYLGAGETFIDEFSVFISTVWALCIGTNTTTTVQFTEKQ